MRALFLAAVLAAQVFAAEVYELAGQLAPPAHAAVTLFGSTFPFHSSTESELNGRFRFRKLRPGTYTVAVLIPEKGEARQTLEIGPGTADANRVVRMSLSFKDSDFTFKDMVRREHSVSTGELAMPAKAVHEYEEAIKDLGRHDVPSAVAHFEACIKLAPQYSPAWNNLGTIAYQTRNYQRAEDCFRQALAQDPLAFEPLVNLGGVLLTVQKIDEAFFYNQRAVLMRPNDALANSQFGMTYFAQNNYDMALRYLQIASRLDPTHFSHPQLLIAEIYLRRGNAAAAADALEDFVDHHPDYATAAKIRESITKLRADGRQR